MEEVEAHLPIPVAWLGVSGWVQNGSLQRRQKEEVTEVEDDDVMGLHQGLQRGRTVPVSHQQAARGVGGAREAVE